MELKRIHASGIVAWCSDVIVEPPDLETVCLLSIGGYQAAVKGIVANLVEGYGVAIQAGEEHWLNRGDFGYKILLKRLPSGLAHALVFPKPALARNGDEEAGNRFFVFAQDGADVARLFFRHLDNRTELPLHPSWAEWLWGVFSRQQGWLTELVTLAGDRRGYSFNFNHAQLHDIISGGFLNGLPEVVSCLEQEVQ